MFDFSGKTAVITGAGGAIGGEIARGLAQAGAGVAIWDIAPTQLAAKPTKLARLPVARSWPSSAMSVSKSSVKAGT